MSCLRGWKEGSPPQPPSVLFYQTDQLVSTRLLTESAVVVRGTFSDAAHGNLIGSTGAYTSALGWAGQYRDAECIDG